MNALELTQRQRKLLGNIVKAAGQYRQAVADASARLKRENEQIEQSHAQERQRIEEERKQKITEITFKTLAKDAKEKSREEFRQRVEREIAAKRSTITPRRDITTIEAVKREINGLISTKIKVAYSPIEGAIEVAVLLSPIVGIGICFALPLFIHENLLANLLAIVVLGAALSLPLWWAWRNSKKVAPAVANRIVLLHSLYDRWLELVDEQAGAQRAEARRRYDQAVAQAKGQMLAAVEQSRLAIAEFGALAEQVSPSWQSEAWQQWEPGRVGPGAVRLGTFRMTEV